MRKVRSKLWIGWIPYCRCHLGAQNGMDEYYRHGTLSLYAALEVKTGKVAGKTARATPAGSSSISSMR